MFFFGSAINKFRVLSLLWYEYISQIFKIAMGSGDSREMQTFFRKFNFTVPLKGFNGCHYTDRQTAEVDVAWSEFGINLMCKENCTFFKNDTEHYFKREEVSFPNKTSLFSLFWKYGAIFEITFCPEYKWFSHLLNWLVRKASS